MSKDNDTNKIMMKRVALYLRLSKEDFDKPTKETISESIKNQKLMLLEEVKKYPDWRIVGIYCDEDFSGAGTYRPDFEKMIESCKNGEVDIVLCKSQSRFSRDMEVVEKYIHNKFLEWNIRFVSLIDNADTFNAGNKKSRQINALVNEWFLEDLSNNIKETFRTKWMAGECTSSFAKYGLMKDPKNKNHLIIDPIASEVLREIANMFLSGYGQDMIANVLEQRKIPSPYEYKLMNGCKLKLPICKNENKLNISKAGSYVIRVFLYNKYRKILRNIKGFFVIGTDNSKKYDTKFHIKVRSISSDLNLYYTTKDLSSIINNFNDIDFNNNDIWKQLNVNDVIPDNIYCIASSNEELDRLLETGFELELILEENKCHNVYKLFSKAITSNSDENLHFEYEVRKKYKWSGRVIYNMLRDEAYNGTLVQGKTRRVSYKNHKCIRTGKGSWIASEGALEKIFDDDMWNAIQQKLELSSRAGSNGVKHIFYGKVYCGVCGNILHKNCSSNTKSVNKIEYLLCKDKKNKWSNCDNKKAIKLDILKDYVTEGINNLLDKYYDFDILSQMYSEKISDNLFKEKIDNLIKESNDTKRLIEKRKQIFYKLYDDCINNYIDESDFIFLKGKYKEDITKLNDRLLVIDNELKVINDKRINLNDSYGFLLNYKHIDELTLEFVDEFIDKITIGKFDEDNNIREIMIVWKF